MLLGVSSEVSRGPVGGNFWASWEPLGSLVGLPEDLLWDSWGLLGTCWGLFGVSWGRWPEMSVRVPRL
eukprot:2442963-Pyramimonas_sp.AAC.1